MEEDMEGLQHINTGRNDWDSEKIQDGCELEPLTDKGQGLKKVNGLSEASACCNGSDGELGFCFALLICFFN